MIALLLPFLAASAAEGIPFWMFVVVGGIGLVLGALLAYLRAARGSRPGRK